MSLKTIALKSAAKMYIRGKLKSTLQERILGTELNDKVSSGVQKFAKVTDNFWDTLEKVVLREKEVDRKWVPNLVEGFTEDLLLDIIRDMRKNYDINAITQEIFNQLRSRKVI